MRVAIIGASGEMGSFFIRYFLGKGATVRASDLAPPSRRVQTGGKKLTIASSNATAVEGCDVTILAVPMGSTVKVAREVAGRLKPGSTLVEISSVKGGTVSALKKALGGRASLLSIHPLFGPALQSAKGMKIAVIALKGHEARDVSFARSLFPEARIVPMGRREHDVAMAVVLSLTHLLNVVYAGTASRFLTPEEFMRVTTPNSSMQLTLAEAVLAQDPKLSYGIQASNIYSRKVARAASLELKKVMGMIEDEDWKAFKEHFSKLSKRYRTEERGKAVIGEIYSTAERDA